MKNMSACCAGGLMFWALGWALCMGEGRWATPFNGQQRLFLIMYLSLFYFGLFKGGENFSMSLIGWMELQPREL